MSEHRLSEIVIERPRGGMRISLKKVTGFKKQLHRITEEASQDGLLNPYLIKPRNKSKHLSDHLGPLRRFLQSQVGQSWNTVYSKLCRQLDTNTMAGQHVLSHVWDYVEQHVELIDGIPYRKTCHFSFRRLNHCYRDQFYVHPATGILCAVQKTPQQHNRMQSRRDIVILDDYHQYHQLNGIWYLITFAKFPAPTELVKDVLQGLTPRPDIKPGLYAAHKKQCSKKEIRFITNQLSQS